ncbi:hypothetical protein, partial [Cobetia crustatorum]
MLDSHEGFEFDKEDVVPMMQQLLKAGTLELPEPKRPEDVTKTRERNFCRYHRLVGHPTENCYTLKCIIQRMINKGEIITSESKGKSTRVTVNMFSAQKKAREIKGKENRKIIKNAAMITLRSGKQVTSPVKQKVGIARKEVIARQNIDDGNKEGNRATKVAYDVVSHLKGIPAH